LGDAAVSFGVVRLAEDILPRMLPIPVCDSSSSRPPDLRGWAFLQQLRPTIVCRGSASHIGGVKICPMNCEARKLDQALLGPGGDCPGRNWGARGTLMFGELVKKVEDGR